MNKPDNHIDELGEILKGFLKMFDGKTENPLNTATQQIEDFYRNKIPEKREVNVEQPELFKGVGGESAPYFCSACQTSEMQIMENVEGDKFYCRCSYWKSPHNAYLDKYSQDELWLGWKDKKATQDYLESLPMEDNGYNQAIDDITAQFNSKGDNDE